jgi:hypothetical protein
VKINGSWTRRTVDEAVRAVGMAGNCFVLQKDGHVTLFIIISVPQFLV